MNDTNIKTEQILEEIRNVKRNPINKKTDSEIESFVKDLMGKMTLEEKVGQLYQTSHDGSAVSGPSFDSSRNNILIKQGAIGSMLGMINQVDMFRLQKMAVEETRLGIPLFFGNDVIHGHRTGFPQNIAMACSFDEDTVYKASKYSAFEASHCGITMTYSPMVDIVRDPRWGRVTESNGEDTFLSSNLARAYVKGYQQDDLTSYDTLAACVKHYVAYGLAEGGREYNTVDLSERMLREHYLKPFKAAVDAGVESVMTSFNIYNGVPATINKFLLRDVLKGEMKFDGFIISDYTSSGETIAHKVAKDEKDVARKSITAGLDHEMMSTTYSDYLVELVRDGEIEESLIDDSCARILKFKYKVGLFDNPYKNIYPNPSEFFLLEETRQAALEVSKNSIVMLKNEMNVLPLKGKKVTLVGPLANETKVIGAWGGITDHLDCVTLLQGLQNYDVDVNYIKGAEYFELINSDLELIEQSVNDSDVVIMAIGEEQWMSGECNARADITIPEAQVELARKISEMGKPVVGIVFAGRPLIMTDIEQYFSSILYAWFLGTESGNALASTLIGENNPSAKLVMSFPHSIGQIPVYYNALNTGRPFIKENPEPYRSVYRDIPNEPFYEFGYGLSYSDFKYDNITFSKVEDGILIEFDITNKSEFDGTEITQVYIEAMWFSVSRPNNELKGYKRISLLANETRREQILVKNDDFKHYNAELVNTTEGVDYIVKLAKSSSNIIKKEKFNIK